MAPLFQNIRDTTRVERCGDGNGLIFWWSRQGVGFGSLTLRIGPNGLEVDRECMGVDFCADVIRQALVDTDQSKSTHQPTDK